MDNTLNLGEVTILQEEVKPFMTNLIRNDITVSALHNHWLFDQPHVMYLHFESIDNPLSFARKVSDAFRLLK